MEISMEFSCRPLRMLCCNGKRYWANMLGPNVCCDCGYINMKLIRTGGHNRFLMCVMTTVTIPVMVSL
jgi:hypothetical protein